MRTNQGVSAIIGAFLVLAFTQIIISRCVEGAESSSLSREAKPLSLDGYQATISVDYDSVLCDISPLLYGNNTKWLFNGEARYNRDNGIWSVKSNSINPKIKDYLVDSGITILRYGDGTNADYFYWGWSILPMKDRLKSDLQTRWGGGEHYVFGVMEFIKLCETMKCEAILITNYGMGLLESFYDQGKNNDKRTKLEIAIQQAANWVEFMNTPAPMHPDPAYPEEYRPEYSLQKMPKGYFAYVRAELRHPEPVNVKYWEIGNETYGFHLSGGRSAMVGKSAPINPISVNEYTKNAIDFSRKMKLIDPSIKIGIVEHPDLKRQLKMITKEEGAVDFIISHDYIAGSSTGNRTTYTFYGAHRGLRRPMLVQSNGTYKLRVHAWGRAYFGKKYPNERGVPSKLKVRLDNTVLGEIPIDKNIDLLKEQVSREFYWYDMPLRLSKGEHEIEMRLSNDLLDKTFPDMDRMGRDIFIDSIRVTGYEEDQEVLTTSPSGIFYSQIPALKKKLGKRQKLIEEYLPTLFIAQTESAVYPSPNNLSAALGEALILMEDIQKGIKIRNHWHMYGVHSRGGVIHSGDKENEYYHVTPSYFPIQMFSKHFGEELIYCNVTSPDIVLSGLAVADIYEDKTDDKSRFPLLQALASRGNNKLAIAMVNSHENQNARVQLDIRNFKPTSSVKYTLRAKDPKDFMATNEENQDTVFVQTEYEDEPEDRVIIPPNSFTILELSR